MSAQADYPIRIRREDMSISLDGDLLISGQAAEQLRRCLANYPAFYPKFVVPFIKKREESFSPNEFWIDPAGRIHITNSKIVQRMKSHIPSSKRRIRVVGRS